MYFPLLLGLDTSCDETSVAVLKEGRHLLSNVISSQIKIHSPHGGVVPELASRSHLENLPRVVDEALQKAGVDFSDLNGIAVTTSPGLIGCLLVGLSYAKALAYTLNIPLTAVHHLRGHLFSPFVGREITYPFLGLVVSGGHTALYEVENFNRITLLGETVDDAAGEAFDKTAKLMGLGYPGGPLIDKLAQTGNADAYSFTRARVKKSRFHFSFSGLKTAVSLLVKNSTDRTQSTFPANLAASFQKEVIGALVEKVESVLDEKEFKCVAVSGGVAVNSLLRSEMALLGRERGIEVLIPSPLLCTDNGGMIAHAGYYQLLEGKKAAHNLNAYASLPLW